MNKILAPAFRKTVKSGTLAMILAVSGLAAQGVMAKGRCGPAVDGGEPEGKPVAEHGQHHGKHHRKHDKGRRGMGRPGMGMPEMGMPRHMMKRLFSKLDLTDDQKQQIKSIHQAVKEETKDLHQSMCELQQQMPALADADPVDEQAIRALASQIADVRASLMLKHLQAKKQVEAVLTDEQRAKLEKIKEKRRARREDDSEE